MVAIAECLKLNAYLVHLSLRAIFRALFVPAKWYSKNVSGQVCLITGGAAGIGFHVAKRFSSHHCKMVLVDINKDALAKAAEECRASGAESVNTYTCDLSDRHQVYSMTEKVQNDLGYVQILVNNAGIVSGKPLLELDDEVHIERSFKINVLCHFWLIKAFLPAMLRHQVGHIVTVASMAGLIAPTTQTVDYASTKFAAVGLGESLEHELHSLYKTTAIKHTLVCPFFVSTGMFHGVSAPFLTPEYVAEKIFEGVLTDTHMVMLPRSIRIMAILKYLLPRSYFLRKADYIGATKAMSTFEGHKTT